MSRQLLISLGFLLVGLVSGIGIGLFAGGGTDASAASEKIIDNSSSGSSPDFDANTQHEEESRLAARIRDLEKELSAQKRDQSAILANRLAFFKKYHDQIRVRGVYPGSIRVSHEMAEILELSKEEQAAVEAHLAQTKAAMDKLQDEDTVVSKQSANSVTFEIPPDSKGKALEDELQSLLSADIGDDRAQLLMSAGLYGEGPNNYEDFGNFSQGKKDIEISWTQQNGSPLYTIKESNFGPDGKDTYGSSYTTTSLPTKYQQYLQGDSTP